MTVTEESLRAEGWAHLPTAAFSGAIGPSFARDHQGVTQVGVLAGEMTANENIGIVHGGAILTFADIAMGYAVAHALGNAHCATAQLQYQFAGAARLGEFIVCEPEIVRKTSQLVFVRGLMRVGERTIGSADAIFKVLDEAKLGKLKAG